MKRIVVSLSAVAALLLAGAGPAGAEVTQLEITSKAAYGTFRPGDYVLWKGRVHGEISPAEAIPDLDKAARNARGKVEYASDIMLLMPADPFLHTMICSLSYQRFMHVPTCTPLSTLEVPQSMFMHRASASCGSS